MQMDIRSYKKWIEDGHWHHAQDCIAMGAEILADKRDQIRSSVGKEVAVRTSAGKSYRFTGKELGDADLLASR